MAKFHYLLIVSLVLVVTIAGATQFKVGGPKGWAVPTDPKEYSQWAVKRRFQIGDSLLFVYRPDVDSVLYVNETSYDNCDTSLYIDTFDDGNTIFTFTRSGPHYFISSNRDNCLKNESLQVVVMADRSNQSGLAPSPSASASASSPPAPGSVEFVPASSPPSPNWASSKVVNLMGSCGALIGSLYFVL